MAKLQESDFYYGAILSKLINSGICPILIEGGEDRQVYNFTTNDKEFLLFVKYRSTPLDTKKEGYNSWQFIFSEDDIKNIKAYLAREMEFSIGLICGAKPLAQSQYAALDRITIEKLLEQGKNSVTVSREKRERYFRIAIGGGRENSIKVKADRLY